MPPTKTLRDRERELQALLGTPEGRDELRRLEACYSATDRGRARVAKTSVITYILVFERERGLIVG